MSEIKHSIQIEILRNLLFKKKAGFAELNTTELTNDHFTYHVKRLLKRGIIKKLDTGDYQLTEKGLEISSRIELKSMEFIKQPKVGVILCVVKSKPKNYDDFMNTSVLR